MKVLKTPKQFLDDKEHIVEELFAVFRSISNRNLTTGTQKVYFKSFEDRFHHNKAFYLSFCLSVGHVSDQGCQCLFRTDRGQIGYRKTALVNRFNHDDELIGVCFRGNGYWYWSSISSKRDI